MCVVCGLGMEDIFLEHLETDVPLEVDEDRAQSVGDRGDQLVPRRLQIRRERLGPEAIQQGEADDQGQRLALCEGDGREKVAFQQTEAAAMASLRIDGHAESAERLDITVNGARRDLEAS